jgi:hypothetical protein
MKEHQFYAAIKAFMKSNPNQRKGQSAFNLMFSIFPSIAQKYRASNMDPFYNDDNTGIFVTACIAESNSGIDGTPQTTK